MLGAVATNSLGSREDTRPADVLAPPPQASEGYDVTSLPTKLDSNFKVLDTDSQLRPTTVKATELWTKRSKQSILADFATTSLALTDLNREKHRALDLLDALTRSGALPLQSTTLHVLVAATHAFDRSITDTLVVDNVAPVLKAERASLIIASTLHDKPPAELVHPSRLAQVAAASPLLLQAALRTAGDGDATSSTLPLSTTQGCGRFV